MSNKRLRYLVVLEKGLFGLVACLMLGLTAPVKAQSADDDALRALTSKFFAAYEKKSLDEIISMWSEKSSDLDAAQQGRLMQEIDRAARLLHVFRPQKLNVAALGNLVPQLHVHVIARFEHDPAWPSPVWGRVAARPYTPEMLVERIALLQETLVT